MKKTLLVVWLMVLTMALAVALTAPRAAAQGTVNLNAAGATFPYPIYSKWFDVYHTAHPNIQINYQSIGSGGGIRQLQAGTVDFGASDGPMTDEQLAESKFKILHFPTVLGADVPTYNIPGVTAELNFTQKALADIYPRQHHQVERSGDRQSESRSESPGQRHRRRTPLRRQRHHLHLDRLPLQGQRRLEEQSRQGRHLRELARRPRRQGQRRRHRTREANAQLDRLRRADLRRPEQDYLRQGSERRGKFIKADLAGVTAAAAGAAKNMPEDFRVSITNAPGATAYPISSFTWLLIPAQISGRRQARRHQRLPEVDAHRRPEVQRRSVLRAASQRRCRQGN